MSFKDVVRPPACAPSYEEESVKGLRNKKRILIVDDDPCIVETMKDILEEKGYSTLVAYDGEQAFHAIDGLKHEYGLLPDFILMDVKMPNLDGIETCMRLKSIPAYSMIPVCFVSAYISMGSKILKEDSGAVGVIYKPANFEALFKLIEETTGTG